MKASKQAMGSTFVKVVSDVFHELKPILHIPMPFDLRSYVPT